TRSTIRRLAAATAPTVCCWKRWPNVVTNAAWWRASPALAPAGTRNICANWPRARFRRCPRKTAWWCFAAQAVPFGPDCAFPSAAKTEVLRQADAVVGVSRYVADYIRKWSGIPAVHVPISLLDPPPYPDLGRFENEFVTLVNPCAVKGI